MSENESLRRRIRHFLNLVSAESAVPFEIADTIRCEGYARQRINYKAADGDNIPAYLLIPAGQGPFPAVLIHHQHASQRHLGKSEVAGLAGDPLQAFGPALARRGFVILAPDSICFEDRRKYASGIARHERDDIQHFIEMAQRIAAGDTLMRKVLSDASYGLSLLAHHPQVDSARTGALGHSYGGNTVLFQVALDERVAYAVSSGALCSYAYKRAHDIPLELALIIPGFVAKWDLHHLLSCFAPRPLLIVSAEDDQYSRDAQDVIDRAQRNDHVVHFRDAGGHPMTRLRFDRILDFVETVGNG